MLAVPSVPIEKDQVRSHAVVGVFVDPKKPLNGGPSSAFGDRVQLSNFEGGVGHLLCTGWCMLPSPSLLGG
jgi:hypothetical protein